MTKRGTGIRMGFLWIGVILIAAVFFCSCGSQNESQGSSEASEKISTGGAVSEDGMEPIFAGDLKEGAYEITVDSSSSMFRVVKAVLTVKDGTMEAVLTMSGQGYGMLYMGTGEEALADSEDQYIPFVLNEEGKKTFTVPVEALNQEVDCAAWSIRKEKWYDRVIIFESELLPPEAFLSEIGKMGARGRDAGDGVMILGDGEYSVKVTLTGGSGKASVESPAKLTMDGETAMATLVWSSPNYEFMLVDGVQYDAIQTKGNSTFLIPVKLDEKMEVSAQTIAMSEPHLVDYTLFFDSATLKK